MKTEPNSKFRVLDDAELDCISGGHGSVGCTVFGGLVGLGIAAISSAGGPIIAGSLGVIGGAAAAEACNNH